MEDWGSEIAMASNLIVSCGHQETTYNDHTTSTRYCASGPTRQWPEGGSTVDRQKPQAEFRMHQGKHDRQQRMRLFNHFCLKTKRLQPCMNRNKANKPKPLPNQNSVHFPAKLLMFLKLTLRMSRKPPPTRLHAFYVFTLGQAW